MNKYVLTERSELFEPNVYIETLVDIEGPVEEDDIVNAVKNALAANESLMCCIEINEDGKAEYKRMNVSRCGVYVENNDWQDIIRENEKKPFAIDKGELMRVFIIRNDMKYSLLVMAHHLAGDGKSITYYISDVMKSLKGEALSFKPMNIVTADSLPKNAKMSLPLRLMIRNVNRKWRKCGRTFFIEDYYKLHNSYWYDRSSSILAHNFSKDELDILHSKCRNENISINNIITAAFLKADPSNETVGMAVNIRNKGDYSMSNQVSGLSIKMIYDENKSIKENALIFQQKVSKILRDPSQKYFVLKFMAMLSPSLTDSVLMHIYGLYENKITDKMSKIMGYNIKKKSDIGITNLTKLDIPNVYGDYYLKNFTFVPPAVSYADHLIGIASMDEGMSVTYHFMNNKDIAKEKEFFDNAIKNIISIVTS